MINNIETINKILDFFKALNIKGESIIPALEKLQRKEEVLKRYYSRIKEKEEIQEERKIYRAINPKFCDHYRIYRVINPGFCVQCSDKDILNDLKELFNKHISIGQFSVICIKRTKSGQFLDTYKRFTNKIRWKDLSGESHFDWTLENIEKGILFDIIDWTKISKNPSIRWDLSAIERYKNYLDWTEISKKTSIKWDFDFVDRYENYLDWTEISKNPSIKWGLYFVKRYKGHLDWRFVKVNNRITWDDELIMEYSGYIFSSETMDNSSQLQNCKEMFNIHRMNFELNENIRWSDYLIDRYVDKWNWELLSRSPSISFTDDLIEKHHDKWDFKCLSEIPNIKISTRLIEKYIDKWDLDKLVRNESIKLEFSTIDKLKDVLDWNFIIVKEHLTWNIKLFQKYSNYIFLASNTIGKRIVHNETTVTYHGYIESNENVLWTDSLIYEYKDQWRWKILIQNPKVLFTDEQLEKYKDHIPWNIFCEFGNTNWSESVIDKYCTDSLYYWKKTGRNGISYLVENQHVVWDENLFAKLLENESIHILATFCRYAKIPNEIIIKYQSLWKKEKNIRECYKRNSDGVYHDDTYQPLWFDLFVNRNIVWTDYLLESCIGNITLNNLSYAKMELSVEFINKYWDFSREEIVWHRGDYNSGSYSKKEILYLRHQIKNCRITNLTMEKFIKYEFKWLGSRLIDVYSKGFSGSNKSIEELIVSETENQLLKYKQLFT